MKFTSFSKLSTIALALSAAITSTAASAGEVTVVSNDGLFASDITVTGSREDDSIAIRRNTAGDLIIVGRRGTTINFNGSTRNRANLGPVVNASISMRAGNDRIRIRDVAVDSLDIRLGRGNDLVQFDSGLQLRESGILRGGAGRDVLRGDIHSLNFSNIEVADVVATAYDIGDPTVVASDIVNVVEGETVSGEFFTGESFVVPADFTGSATIVSFDSHGERGAPQDSIDVSAIDADVTQPGNQAFTLVVNFRGNPGELIIPNESDLLGPTVVAGDTDGDAVADFTITLGGFQQLQGIGPWFDNFIP